ncbi:MAG: EAL domain-containing protein [Clostridia bacterium]|nr:EAL domain-containing protein [Clostridia bacterium]
MAPRTKGRNFKGLLSRLLIPLILIIGVLCAILIVHEKVEDTTLTRVKSILRTASENHAQVMSATLEGKYGVLESFADELAWVDNYDIPELQKRMDAVKQAAGFDRIFVLDAYGKGLTNDGRVFTAAQREYFSKSMHGRRALDFVETSVFDNQSCFVLAVPIRDDRGAKSVLAGSYMQEGLRKLLISNAYGEESYAYVVDADGHIIIGADGDYFDGKSRTIDELLSDATFSEGYSLDKIRNALQSNSGGDFSYSKGGRQMYCFFQPVTSRTLPLNDWYIAEVIPAQVISDDVRTTTSSIAIRLGLIFLLALLLILFSYYTTSRNERALADETIAKRVAEQTASELRAGWEQARIALAHSSRIIMRYNVKTGTLYYFSDASPTYTHYVKNVPDALIENGEVAPESAEDFIAFCDAIKRGEPNGSVEVSARWQDSENYIWVRADYTLLLDDEGRPDMAVISAGDVTAQIEKELAYRRWRKSIELLPENDYAIYEYNLSTDTRVNYEGHLFDLVEVPRELDFDGRTYFYASKTVHPDDRDEYIALMQRDRLIAAFYEGAPNSSMDFRLFIEGRDMHWVRLTAQLTQYPNSKEIKLYLLYQDIDPEKRKELALKDRAERDSLTSAYNRQTFFERANAAIAQSGPDTRHALLYIDLDHFKMLNDTLGHAAGDEALIQAAASIRSVLRTGDLVGRIGGDEFAVFLQNIPYNAVMERRAQQICSLLRKTYNNTVQLSASIGVAIYPDDGETLDDIALSADKALYYVKDRGRDGYQFCMGEAADLPAVGETVQGHTGKKLILAIDNNAASLHAIERALGDAYHLETASNSLDAERILKRYGSSISVVLLDIHMPQVDGVDFLMRRKSNKEFSMVPVIAMCDEPEKEDIQRALRAGAWVFLSKPLDMELLNMHIENAIIRTENDQARLQDGYLQLQDREEARYRSVIASTKTVVFEADLINNVYTYDALTGALLSGNYDSRPLWTILSTDGVADEKTILDMQRLMEETAELGTDEVNSMDVLLKTASGEHRWFKMNVVRQGDTETLSKRLFLTLNDVNEEKLSNEHLRYLAEYDELTSIYNRAAFLRHTREMIDKAPNETYAFIYFDIDRFKAINEVYGHAEGDRLLCLVANTLQELIGDLGICSRISGDLFAAFVRYTKPSLPTELLGGFNRRIMQFHLPFEFTSSFGIYVVDDPSLPTDVMIDKAALAQKSIKGSYITRIAYYDDTMNAQVLEEQSITAQMEAALRDGQFVPFLQPKVDYTSGDVVGAEALVRWLHPETGLIPPGKFIPLFERNGFISKLDPYIWEQVCKLLHAWMEQGRSVLPISVNVSRLDLQNINILEVMCDLVEKYDIPPALLHLEITETAYVDNPALLNKALASLRTKGFIIEMDDFGSGFSSLNTLRDAPVDILKLDTMFVSDGRQDARGAQILRSIIELAQSLRLGLIAEGVESEDVAEQLCAMGCRHMQGYYFSKPVDVDEFVALLSTANKA